MNWDEIFRYKDGKLYHLPKEVTSTQIKSWNSKWAGKEAGSLKDTGYIVLGYYSKFYKAHRIIYEMLKGKIPNDLQIDHINCNRSDNRIENLQLVTHKQNHERKNNSKGYSIDIRRKSRAYIARKIYNNKQ